MKHPKISPFLTPQERLARNAFVRSSYIREAQYRAKFRDYQKQPGETEGESVSSVEGSSGAPQYIKGSGSID